jgi:ABC-type Fe3+ transport system permease subunit
LWIVVQAAGEVAVTDPFVVRSFAEEVYTQFATGGGLGAAVALSLPQIILVAMVALVTVHRWQVRAPALFTWPVNRPFWVLGKSRWLWTVAVFVVIAVLLAVPVLNLVWKAGGGAGPAGWSIQGLADQFRLVVRSNSFRLLESLAWAVSAGMIAAGAALITCWLARDWAWLRTGLVFLTVALWVIPGPVLGYGVKEAINRLMDLEDLVGDGWTTARPVAALFYYWPSPLPVLWVDVLRVFPFTVALLWPAFRSIPRDLLEAARVDGAGPAQEFRYLVWPLMRGALLQAVLVGTVLAFGELSASKMVEVPGHATFTQELFNQMHYGVTATVATLCLLQLFAVSAVGLIMLRLMNPNIFRRSAPIG